MEGIIRHQSLIDLTTVDYVDEHGFFFRCQGAGNIKYCAVANKLDTEAVTDTFDASPKFDNVLLARKIFRTGTTATGIYVGKSI